MLKFKGSIAVGNSEFLYFELECHQPWFYAQVQNVGAVK